MRTTKLFMRNVLPVKGEILLALQHAWRFASPQQLSGRRPLPPAGTAADSEAASAEKKATLKGLEEIEASTRQSEIDAANRASALQLARQRYLDRKKG